MPKSKHTRRNFLRTTGSAALAGMLGSTGVGCRTTPTRDTTQATPKPPPTDPAPPPAAPDTTPPVPEPVTADTGQVDRLLVVPEALFRPTASGCTIHWVPKQAVEARILAGTDADSLALVKKLESVDPVEVAVHGLPADSDIFVQSQFRKPGREEWLARPTRKLRTARKPGQTFRVALIADSHVYRADGNEERMRNLNQTNQYILAGDPDFALFLGDEAGIRAGRAEMDQQRAYNRWALWRRSFAALTASVPSFMCIGNHEGEAGFYQERRSRGKVTYPLRWGTVARKRYYLNPLPDTYPEGGENEGWVGDPDSPATGGADEGNCSPFHNYYAWTWGDALFVVIDVHRYTNIGRPSPKTPEEWTLGPAQRRWFETVMTNSRARWKFVVAHHVLGGWPMQERTAARQPGAKYAYGRGGARYARVGEQAWVTDLMKRTGAQFFLYGHDHIFAHQRTEGLHYICCGRPTWLDDGWWKSPYWQESYGRADARDPHDFYAAVGYARLTVSPESVLVEYVRSGTDPDNAENVDAAEGEVVYAATIT